MKTNWMRFDRFRTDVLWFFFKHSPRCPVSVKALNLFESDFGTTSLDKGDVHESYLVNVLEEKNISHHLTESYGIKHESPQVLLISKGNCIHHASHERISYAALLKSL
ncbi:MAG: bacillithiol system redox-active protein YtxJ [Cytophagales bacterium]|nr:bacillithiol system redox-active protein YtxJ [Cytophagales bacterium]